MPRRVVSKRQEFQHSILVYTLLRFCGAGGRDVDSFVEVKACVRGTEIVVARRLHPSRGILCFFESRLQQPFLDMDGAVFAKGQNDK